MTSEQFWITIGNARSTAKPGESIEKALTAELRQFPPSAIVEQLLQTSSIRTSGKF